MDRETVRRLVHLARQSAATWQRTRGSTFRGETVLATANARYRFVDGVFEGRVETAESDGWDKPASLVGLELIGFLADEGGFFSFSPRWRAGALAVLWNARAASDDAFTLTSPTLTCFAAGEAERAAPDRSSVFRVASRTPPSVRRPAPTSMTKLHAAPRPPDR